MSIMRFMPVMAALLCVGISTAQAGLFKFGSSCGDSCTTECNEQTCCPSDYCCVPECKTEKLKQHCFEIETKPVVVPPVKLPNCGNCLKKLFRRGGCDNGCSNGCCDGGGCADGCDGGCGSGSGGLMSRLCSKFTKCRVRCVKTYTKKEFECGTKCVCEWKAVKKDGCGSSGGCGTGSYCEPACSAPGGCQ